MLELFEERLPALAAELRAGRAGLGEGVALYHMVLEGIVFDAGGARCATTWPTAPCRGSMRAYGASSSTSAGTSASACAA